jgi:SMODS and SLOG-associating 2TM effector domain 1/SLOG in TRPM, prokaryote/Protein of unknown function (DUF4231)
MTSIAIIEIAATDSFEAAAAKVTQQADVILLLFGEVDQALGATVRSVFERAVVPVALIANALVIDNGKGDGIAGLLGQAAKQLEQSPFLLGILSPNENAPDSNHSALLRLPAEWDDIAKSSFLLTAEFARKQDGIRPVAALLIGGGQSDMATALRCARRGWPLLIVQGAGGLGDMILSASAPPADGSQAAPIAEPDLREILDTATISSIPLGANTDDLKRRLFGPIQQVGDILPEAWGRFDDLDLAAIEKEALFRTTQFSILALTVIATLMAIAISGSGLPPRVSLPWFQNLDVREILHVLMIAIPILISMLGAFNARFREGNKWLLLRAAAESIKSQIFRYRTRTGIYSDQQCIQISAPLQLAGNIKDITTSLAQSEVNRSSLPHRHVVDPARLRILAPEDYLRERVEDQIGYFVTKTAALYRQLKQLQVWILIVGGLGTFLAAIRLEVWVALTTALAAAFTNKLEIDQVENSLVQYNVTLTNLRNIQSWWKGLTSWEKTRGKNIDLLVDQTEKALERATAGWVQQMQSTLDKLTEKEKDPDQQAASDRRN